MFLKCFQKLHGNLKIGLNLMHLKMSFFPHTYSLQVNSYNGAFVTQITYTWQIQLIPYQPSQLNLTHCIVPVEKCCLKHYVMLKSTTYTDNRNNTTTNCTVQYKTIQYIRMQHRQPSVTQTHSWSSQMSWNQAWPVPTPFSKSQDLIAYNNRCIQALPYSLVTPFGILNYMVLKLTVPRVHLLRILMPYFRLCWGKGQWIGLLLHAGSGTELEWFELFVRLNLFNINTHHRSHLLHVIANSNTH